MRQAWRPTRHIVDAIARAVVTGRRGYGRRVDGFADRVAARMHNRLDATLLRLLLDRAAKYLAAWGLRGEARARQA